MSIIRLEPAVLPLAISAKVKIPSGKTELHNFRLKVREPTMDAIEEFARLSDDSGEPIATAKDWLVDHILDWSEVDDEDGPVDFTEENLRKLLSIAPYFHAISENVIELCSDKGKGARRKN